MRSYSSRSPRCPAHPRDCPGGPRGASRSDAAAIQAVIDAAAELQGQRPIIHFAIGQYPIESYAEHPDRLRCPVGRRGHPLQHAVAVDGRRPSTHCEAGWPDPRHASGSGVGRIGEGRCPGDRAVRSAGGRVFFDQVQVDGAMEVGYLINGAELAQVQLRDCGRGKQDRHEGRGRSPAPAGAAHRRPRRHTQRRVQQQRPELRHFGRRAVVGRDIWYETGSKPRFLHFTSQGEFTLHG